MADDGSIDFSGFAYIQRTWANLSSNVRVRQETSRWAKVRSIQIRQRFDPTDLRDIEVEDFIDEAMIDIQAELDLQEINYSTWTVYSSVPGQIRRATIYATIEILLASKLESFKARIIPTMGPVRVQIVERDAMKAIDFFKRKREEAVRKFISTVKGGGSYMRSSTIDDEPIFDMEDLQDKVTLEGAETSWFKWLLGNR